MRLFHSKLSGYWWLLPLSIEPIQRYIFELSLLKAVYRIVNIPFTSIYTICLIREIKLPTVKLSPIFWLGTGSGNVRTTLRACRGAPISFYIVNTAFNSIQSFTFLKILIAQAFPFTFPSGHGLIIGSKTTPFSILEF